MKLVVDASVAIKWAVEENQHAAARALVTGGDELVAPDFIVFEVANILWKKARRGEISRQQAMVALPGIRSVFSRLVPAVVLADSALALAAELGHPVYDCLYLAAAQSESARIVTADRRFLKAVAGSAYTGLVTLLDEVS